MQGWDETLYILRLDKIPTYLSRKFTWKGETGSNIIEKKVVPVTLQISGMRGLRKLNFSGIMEEEVENP